MLCSHGSSWVATGSGFWRKFVQGSLEEGSSSTIRDMGVEQVFISREEVSQPKKGKGKGQSKDAGPPGQSPVVPKPNLNPDEQLKAAQARVVKLEAAIVALGDKDPAVAGLKEALAKARAQALGGEGPNQQHNKQHNTTPHNTQQDKNGLAKNGLAKIGPTTNH